jgi:hypothetical protein
MIRGLVIIAAAGLVMSVVCISAAVMIGGPAVFAHGVWFHGPHVWRWESHGGRWSGWTVSDADTPPVERRQAWSGGDQLEVEVPADVTFTQTPGAPQLVIRAPKATLDHVVVEGGRIHFDGAAVDPGDISIELSAPKVTHFAIAGSGELAIRNYNQDTLAIDLSGSGDASVQGAARSLKLGISGSGDADLTQLTLRGAQVQVSGSGSAVVAPTEWADLDISGSGDIRLLTQPLHLKTHVSGSGDVEQGRMPTLPPSARRGALTPA